MACLMVWHAYNSADKTQSWHIKWDFAAQSWHNYYCSIVLTSSTRHHYNHYCSIVFTSSTRHHHNHYCSIVLTSSTRHHHNHYCSIVLISSTLKPSQSPLLRTHHHLHSTLNLSFTIITWWASFRTSILWAWFSRRSIELISQTISEENKSYDHQS